MQLRNKHFWELNVIWLEDSNIPAIYLNLSQQVTEQTTLNKMQN